MKKVILRVLAALLVLILCLGPVSGLYVNAATVSYSTGSADGFYNVIRNWGTRGEDADFLSPNAIDFYTNNNTSYSELSELSGSSAQSSVPYSALYKELQTLMKSNHTRQTNYGNIRYLFAFTDCEMNNTTKLSEFYLGKTINSKWDYGETFNREHCWPKSKTDTPTVNNNTTGEAADIISQRPADPSTNTSRSNKAYGTGSGYFNPNSKQQYGDDVRGDVARIVLYVYVRWGNTSRMWGSTGVMQSKDVLLDWMEADPVDTWEMGRNDSVESITGTRNVFVDYPELAFQLFNEDVPSGYNTPSGGEDGGTYTVKASTNNGNYGTVSVSGNVITASPKSGYEVSSYTILSGSATVIQNGYKFIVDATGDCSIRINFRKRDPILSASTNNGSYGSVSVSGNTIIALPAEGYIPNGYTILSGNGTVLQSGNVFSVTYTEDVSIRINFAKIKDCTLTFKDNGNTVSTVTQQNQTVITLPDRTDSVLTDNTFMGWVTETVADTNICPETVYKAGSTYTVTENTTFHALYTKWEEGGEDNVFNQYTGELTAGDYLLVYNSGALSASVSDKNRFNYSTVTAVGNSVATENAALLWHIEKLADGYYTLYNESIAAYAAGNGTKNQGALIADITDYAKWRVTGSGTYEFVNLGNTNKGINANLRRNGTYGFATYSAATGGALTLYKQTTGSVVYTTSPEVRIPTYTVTFQKDDGTVISQAAYHLGDAVTVPGAPVKEPDGIYSYEFAGWTPEVTAVTGDATYTATYTATKIIVESAILEQPEAVAAESGDTVQFKVTAQGEVVSYKWEYRKIYKWFDTTMTGYNADTLTVDATGARNGYDYRCTVTFADGTVIVSEPAELTVKTYIINVQNPNDQTAVLGSKGQFTASAEGEGIKYQWQYQRPNSELWIDTAMEGAAKPTVFIETTTARDGYKYRCQITDVTGNVVYTEPATMRVLSFKSHPQNATGSVGDNVTFTVTTSVDTGFTYQWQYRRNATANWTNTTMSGYNTDTLTVAATAARNGYQYRCILTGAKNSKIESKEATLVIG